MAKHIIIGGGSGFIGSALTKVLRDRGDKVTVLSRTPGDQKITWDSLSDGLPPCDAVINLAGEHILQPGRRWNEAYKTQVITSRTQTTKQLVDAINAAPAPPRVFVSTAGKCFYGTQSGTTDYPELDEDSAPMGADFPSELVGQWENAADHLFDTVRHVRVRIGIVLGKIDRGGLLGRLWRVGRSRGLLPLIRLPFCFGLGARLGKGTQPFPWIHIDDMVGILIRVINDGNATGRFNAVAPGIVSNAEFTSAFGKAIHRPVVWSIPQWLIYRLVGAERASILVEGQRVVPKRTLAMGYRFEYPTIDKAMDDLVDITI